MRFSSCCVGPLDNSVGARRLPNPGVWFCDFRDISSDEKVCGINLEVKWGGEKCTW